MSDEHRPPVKIHPNDLREIREAAGVSLDKAAAYADVSSPTARIFELNPDAVRSETKRAALHRVYAGFLKRPRSA